MFENSESMYKEEFMYQYLFLSDPWEDETKLGLVKRKLMK